MNEENKQQNEPVNQQKRTALLRYMTILFAVAFALVLLSYLVQVFNSRSTITQLNAASASALQNAERLQDTNRELTEQNNQLKAELEYWDQEYKESVRTEKEGARIDGRNAGIADTQAVYDILVKAAMTEDETEKARLLKELEDKEDYLSDEAKAAIQTLKTPKEAEPKETETP